MAAVQEDRALPSGARSAFGGDVATPAALIMLTITLSVCLINFNNYLMQASRFPYAAPLVLMHMAFCSVCAIVLRVIWPSLFPSLTDPDRKVTIDRPFILRGVVPIAAAFASSLVLTNMVYSSLSVSFIQMLKETAIIVVYLFSLAAGLEVFSWRHVQVIIFAIFAAMLTIRGELAFNMFGFVIQMSSMVCESVRIVLQSILLSDRKLDALSYVLVVFPVCFLMIASAIAGMSMLPPRMLSPHFAIPSHQKVHEYGPLLAANCTLAFVLNVSIALLIKQTSAVSYIFCGVVKDIVAVLVSVVVLHAAMSPLQAASFALQILAVITWSMLKMRPAAFEPGVLYGVVDTLRHGLGGGAGGPLPGARHLTEDADGLGGKLGKNS